MSPQSPSDNLLLFISHKHVDKKIADVISSFVTMHSGGRVKVFQSSSPWTDAPKVGRNLNKQLRETLWNTNVLILIYTTADQDWAYCMWECGVASHPKSPDTRIILFQCAGVSPAVFAEQVNVNVRDTVDIQNFTGEFLTSPDFFPGYSKALTKFQPKGRDAANAAADLFQKLNDVLPPEYIDSIEWPAYPFLQLELGFVAIEQIRNLKPKGRKQNPNEIIKENCIVSTADRYCEQLFGVLGFPKELTLQQLAQSWREKFPNSRSRWVEALCLQLRAGALSRFPQSSWEVMQGFNDHTWRAPVLTRVRNIPSRKVMQFDIYFFKFDVPAGSDSVTIDVPSSTRKKRSIKKNRKVGAKKKVTARKAKAKPNRRTSGKKSKTSAKKKPGSGKKAKSSVRKRKKS
jgi:hypothetical protein